MKALVLGGSIFIGLHLVRLLSSQGHQVTVLNRGISGTKLPEGVARLTADRGDASQVKAALKGASYDAAFDISGYTPATLEPVIEALEGRVGHYAFCSTSAVYAPSDVAPVEEDFPLHRGPEADDYARNKILCEDFLLEAFDRRGFPATIIRPPYVYGPHNKIADREFSFFARLTQRRPVIIPGDGHTLFHPVHVDDLAAAFAAAPGRESALGQAYTACGPEAITANGYVRTIGEVMEVVPETVHVAPGEFEALCNDLGLAGGTSIYPYDWVESRVFSIEKARRDLGWSPGYSMREGLAMTYRWWLERGLDKEDWDFSQEERALELIRQGSGR